MKKLNQAVLLLIIVLLFSVLSACNVFDGTDTPVDNSSADSSSVQAVENGASTVDSSGSEPQTAVSKEESSVFQTVTVTQADKAAKIDEFIGNWVDQSDSSRYAIIKKTDIGYSYVDNESTFPAEVKDGVLQIHIEVDDAIATGKYDDATGILTITYQDTETQFKKKE